MQNKKTQVIAVYSPKGGTGKTTMTVHLAHELARKGDKVLVVDMAQFGNVGAVLKLNMKGSGLSNILSYYEFADEGLFSERCKVIKENIQEYSNELVSFDVIIAALPLKMEEVKAEWMEIFFSVLDQTGYDTIVIDTSTEICIRNISIMSHADVILTLIDQDVSSVWNYMLFKDILLGMNLQNKLRLIVTKASNTSGMSVEEISTQLGLPVYSVLPEDKAIRYYNNQRIGLCKRRERYYRRISKITKNLSIEFIQEGMQ